MQLNRQPRESLAYWMDTKAIRWPAVLQLESSAELIFLTSETDLLNESSILASCDERDTLIDSAGNRFIITSVSINQPEFSIAGTVTATAFIEMLQQHINAIGQCCAAKASCKSVEQGIAMIGEMEKE